MTMEEFIDANFGKEVRIGFSGSYIYCDIINEHTKDEIRKASDLYFQNLKDTKEHTKKLLKIYKEFDAKEFREKAMASKLKKVNDDIKKQYNAEKNRRMEPYRIIKGIPDTKENQHMRRIINREFDLKKEKAVVLELSKKDIEEVNKKIKLRIDNLEHDISSRENIIETCTFKIKNYKPFLECESTDIYTLESNGVIVFVNKDYDIWGRYWDRYDYLHRFEKQAEQEEEDKQGAKRMSIDSLCTTDSLLRFFASQYGELLCGKVNPSFIINELLNATIFIPS